MKGEGGFSAISRSQSVTVGRSQREGAMRSSAFVFASLLLVALGSSGEERRAVKRRDLDPQTCVDNFDVHRDKIIRTEDSREMGAKYLLELDLGSRDECLRLCCETDTCDVFVFEEKSPGSCYLFHCGPPEDFKCKFTRHTNFSSAVLAVNRHLAELEDQIKLTKHEQDLASLRKQFQDAPTTMKPTTQVPIQIHETAPPVPVRRCSRFQFECHSSDECIAIYNACDGIPQCADGSDEAPELGCPATTKIPPANYPPREILPHIPPVQQSSYVQENSAKDTAIPHKPAFMSPIPSQEGPQWPHHLDQLPQNNLGSSHIFNHKGGLQVTEGDSLVAAPFEYKSMPYDSMPENNWPHRSWPQMQSEQMNNNDGSQMYHLDMEPKNAWKQQSMQQQMQIQNPKYRLENSPSRLSPEIASDKMNMPVMPNLYQDRDKMWAVPQQNIQEVQETYAPRKMMPINEEVYMKNKFIENEEKNYSQNPTEKNMYEPKKEENVQNEMTVHSNDENLKGNNDNKTNENKNDKKQANKTKKKHLVSESNSNNEKSVLENTKQSKNNPVSSSIIMGKQFEDDVHDGAAERPPGAILLLTLGVCMTSIMVVLIGCRIKMARRRMRRLGKSPFAHDADYLVNGMYL